MSFSLNDTPNWMNSKNFSLDRLNKLTKENVSGLRVDSKENIIPRGFFLKLFDDIADFFIERFSKVPTNRQVVEAGVISFIANGEIAGWIESGGTSPSQICLKVACQNPISRMRALESSQLKNIGLGVAVVVSAIAVFYIAQSVFSSQAAMPNTPSDKLDVNSNNQLVNLEKSSFTDLRVIPVDATYLAQHSTQLTVPGFTENLLISSDAPIPIGELVRNFTPDQKIQILQDFSFSKRYMDFFAARTKLNTLIIENFLEEKKLSQKKWDEIELLSRIKYSLKTMLTEVETSLFSLDLEKANDLELVLPFYSIDKQTDIANYVFTNKGSIEIFPLKTLLKLDQSQLLNFFYEAEKQLLDPMRNLFSMAKVTDFDSLQSFFREEQVDEFIRLTPEIEKHLAQNLEDIDLRVAKALDEERNAIKQDILELLGQFREKHKNIAKARNLVFLENENPLSWEVIQKGWLLGDKKLFSFSMQLDSFDNPAGDGMISS